MMQISEKHNGFQNENDYEDVKKFISLFKTETDGLIGKCVMSLDPVASSGDQVAIGKHSDMGIRANQVSIPLTLVHAARAPRGLSNVLEIALLKATTLRMKSVLTTHNVLKQSADHLLGTKALLQQAAARGPVFSEADIAAYTAKTEDYFLAQLSDKLRGRTDKSSETVPDKGPSTPHA